MDKPIKTYEEILSPVIGLHKRVLLLTKDTPVDKVTMTGIVISYDETTGQFETENSVWVPA